MALLPALVVPLAVPLRLALLLLLLLPLPLYLHLIALLLLRRDRALTFQIACVQMRKMCPCPGV